MPLEPSEVSLFLIIAVAVIGFLVAYTLGSWKKPSKPKQKHHEEAKPIQTETTATIPVNPCLLFQQTGKGYVGYLRKEWGKAAPDQPYPPSCYPSPQNPKGCEFFFKCCGVESKR